MQSRQYATKYDLRELAQQVHSLAETVGDFMLQITQAQQNAPQNAPPMVPVPEQLPAAVEGSAFEDVLQLDESENSPSASDADEENKDEAPSF